MAQDDSTDELRHWQELLAALRKGDRADFQRALANVPATQLEQRNRLPYADWFTGIDMTLLQLTAFVRPELAGDVVQRNVQVDLHSACALGATDFVAELASPQAVQMAVNGFYPLQFALTRGESLEILLRCGDDPMRWLSKVGWFDWEEQAASQGVTAWQPLHMVALGRGAAPHAAVARMLVDAGAELSAFASPLGEMPLHVAAIYGRCKLIAWLVQAGSPVDAPTAAHHSHPVVDRLFATQPFDVFWHTQAKTPLMLAAGEGHEDAVQVLLELGADVRAVDSGGFTPLHYAASAFWNENPTIVRHLIHAGAAIEALSADGLSPREMGERRGYWDSVKLLS